MDELLGVKLLNMRNMKRDILENQRQNLADQRTAALWAVPVQRTLLDRIVSLEQATGQRSEGRKSCHEQKACVVVVSPLLSASEQEWGWAGGKGQQQDRVAENQE